MTRGEQIIGKERADFNLAKLKSGGEIFEIIVHPEKAIDFKNGKEVDIRDALVYEKIFNDAQKGLMASEHTLEKLFKSSEVLEVAKKIIEKGQIQLTAEYRNKLREAKRKIIINIIHRNGIDPRTNSPHPPQRIENAFEEAKIKIDEHKRAEDQIHEILKKLRLIMPIKFEIRQVSVKIPSNYASKAYSILRSFGTVLKDEWQNDGSLVSKIEIPAGLQQDFFDELNSLTHGNVETEVVKRG